MLGSTLENTRLLALETVATEDLRDEPRAAYVSAVERLQAAGALVEHREIPVVKEAMDLTGLLYSPEAYGTWKAVIEASPDLMFSEILARFRGGADVSAADYVAAWQNLDRCREDYARQTAGFDAVILPTSPILPPNIKRLAKDHDYYVTENLLALRNTRIGNLMGLPAVTLPTGIPSCGIMLMGQPFAEERLLRLGAAAEAALA